MDADLSVAVVLLPDFSAELGPLARQMPVWVLNTQANSAAALAVWQRGEANCVTTFRAAPSATAEEACAAMLAEVELHHGPLSADPPVAILEIVGAAASEGVRTALSGIGFTVAAEWPGGFRAVRSST